MKYIVAGTEFNFITDIRTPQIQYSGKHAHRDNIDRNLQLAEIAKAIKDANGDPDKLAGCEYDLHELSWDQVEIDFMLYASQSGQAGKRNDYRLSGWCVGRGGVGAPKSG
jgi:hypothetical protein